MSLRVPGHRRFAAVADDYARYRPGYPAALLEWILSAPGLPPEAPEVVDLGCGTGISSRALAARGARVSGLDPDGAMLERARAAGGGPSYREGSAEATGLPEASADLVTAAQCFHWFDADAVLAEVRRVLRPGGWCAAFWNLRRPGGPAMDGYERLLREFSDEYPVAPRGSGTLTALRARSDLRDAEHREVPHEDLLDEASFLGRARSASYVAHGVADRNGFEAALREHFRRHARGGRFRWSLRTEAIRFR